MEIITFDRNELESRLAKLEKEGLSGTEIFKKLQEEGYTLDSFRYDAQRYKYFKCLVKTCDIITK